MVPKPSGSFSAYAIILSICKQKVGISKCDIYNCFRGNSLKKHINVSLDTHITIIIINE